MRKEFAVNPKDPHKVNDTSTTFFSSNRCLLCSCPGGGHKTICDECLGDLAFNTDACPACAKSGAKSHVCADCLNKPWPFINTTTTLFQYRYPVNHLVQYLKYKQGIDIANYFGNMLCKLLITKRRTLPGCIIPVPLHSGRLISRGYNQSVEIARPLSKQLGIKLDTSYCKRIRATNPQAKLPTNKRKENVRNAFSATKTYGYDHVLLIDDVITTGSTVKELARILNLAGIRRIDVLAITRAG